MLSQTRRWTKVTLDWGSWETLASEQLEGLDSPEIPDWPHRSLEHLTNLLFTQASLLCAAATRSSVCDSPAVR